MTRAWIGGWFTLGLMGVAICLAAVLYGATWAAWLGLPLATAATATLQP